MIFLLSESLKEISLQYNEIPLFIQQFHQLQAFFHWKKFESHNFFNKKGNSEQNLNWELSCKRERRR